MQSSSSTRHPMCERRWEATFSRSSGWFQRIQLYRVSSTGGFKSRTRSRRVTCFNRVLAVIILAIFGCIERQEPQGQVHHVAGILVRRLLCQDPSQGGPQEAPLVHLQLDRVAPVDQDLAALQVHFSDGLVRVAFLVDHLESPVKKEE